MGKQNKGDFLIEEKRYNREKCWLIQCCYWYYVKGQPLIPDYEYDYALKDLQKLEETLTPDTDSPTQMIWGDCESQYPDWAKIKFRVNMTPLAYYEILET